MADASDRPNTHITDLIGTLRVESSAPDNPVEGDFFYNTTTNHLQYYNGTSWIGAPFARE